MLTSATVWRECLPQVRVLRKEIPRSYAARTERPRTSGSVLCDGSGCEIVHESGYLTLSRAEVDSLLRGVACLRITSFRCGLRSVKTTRSSRSESVPAKNNRAEATN